MRFDIRRVETTVSTNDDAKQAAEAGAAEGMVVWALQQKAGRGRQGREWYSPIGNLYCSILLRPACPVRDYGKFSFVAALAVWDVVDSCLNSIEQTSQRIRCDSLPLEGRGQHERCLQGAYDVADSSVNNSQTSSLCRAPLPNPPLKGEGIPPVSCQTNALLIELKWPNDVLVNGKKIGGILLEAGEDWLVVGIGLNVQHVPEEPMYPVTSLALEQFAVPSLDPLLDKLLKALGFWYQTFADQGFAPLRDQWLSRARKGVLRVRLPQEELSGEFMDLDSEGHLRLLLPDGKVRNINAGDVFF